MKLALKIIGIVIIIGCAFVAGSYYKNLFVSLGILLIGFALCIFFWALAKIIGLLENMQPTNKEINNN